MEERSANSSCLKCNRFCTRELAYGAIFIGTYNRLIISIFSRNDYADLLLFATRRKTAYLLTPDRGRN